MRNEKARQIEKVCEWIDIREAALHIGMSIGFLRKQVQLRKIPFTRIGTKALRFRVAELDLWLREGSNQGQTVRRIEPEAK